MSHARTPAAARRGTACARRRALREPFAAFPLRHRVAVIALKGGRRNAYKSAEQVPLELGGLLARSDTSAGSDVDQSNAAQFDPTLGRSAQPDRTEQVG